MVEEILLCTFQIKVILIENEKFVASIIRSKIESLFSTHWKIDNQRFNKAILVGKHRQ